MSLKGHLHIFHGPPLQKSYGITHWLYNCLDQFPTKWIEGQNTRLLLQWDIQVRCQGCRGPDMVDLWLPNYSQSPFQLRYESFWKFSWKSGFFLVCFTVVCHIWITYGTDPDSSASLKQVLMQLQLDTNSKEDLVFICYIFKILCHTFKTGFQFWPKQKRWTEKSCLHVLSEVY